MTFLKTLFGISICFFVFQGSACHSHAALIAHTQPPIPDSIIEKIQEARHPFLMADRDRFRDARKKMHDDIFYERGKEFVKRVEGYVLEESPWYLGNGPLSENEDFHPEHLTGENLFAYAQAICETIAYTGIEQERWAMNRLELELQRLLNALEPKHTITTSGMPENVFTPSQALLFSLATFMYDTLYYRIDTVDRHPINEQFKRIRDRLAAYCNGLDIQNVNPYKKATLGSALGLSTLFCISVYPMEWEKDRLFRVEVFLPDLFRAVNLSVSGMQEAITQDRIVHVSLRELEAILLTGIPWFECIKSMGYAFMARNGLYRDIAATLEAYRIPGTTQILVPETRISFHNPWIPRSKPIFWVIDPVMYEKELSIPSELPTVARTQTEVTNEQPFGVPNDVYAKEVRKKFGGKRLSLREQLELYSYPRKKKPVVQIKESSPVDPEAGWGMPEGLTLPSLWGAVYLLAAQEDLSSNYYELWSEMASESDSHPYSFLVWRPMAGGRHRNENKPVLVQNPEQRFSLFSFNANRENYLVSTQSATSTILIASYAIDHESFFLSENRTEWQWYHEMPAEENETTATRAISASSTVLASFDDGMGMSEGKKANHIRDVTPMITNMYSCWPAYSPSGKTLIVRRHLSGVGSGFTIVAHFPSRKNKKNKTEYVNFALQKEADCIAVDEVPGMFQLIPEGAEEAQEKLTIREYKLLRKAEREGEFNFSSTGMLNILFSPDSLVRSALSEGVLGRFSEMQLTNPEQPFFYILTMDMPGREVYEVKYSMFPMPGMRVLEWNQGTEIVAVKVDGDTIENSFIESDADFVLMTRDSAMKGIFYLMVNGSYLRAKFSPTQRDFILLADTKGKQLTAAWANLRLHTSDPPRPMSVFYAPNIVGFECPNTVINYGKKGRQAVVWGHDLVSRR